MLTYFCSVTFPCAVKAEQMPPSVGGDGPVGRGRVGGGLGSPGFGINGPVKGHLIMRRTKEKDHGMCSGVVQEERTRSNTICSQRLEGSTELVKKHICGGDARRRVANEWVT